MNYRRKKSRTRLLQLLTEGSRQVRANAARRALPLLTSTLHVIKTEHATATACLQALREAKGGALATNPVIERKARSHLLWASAILLVEIGLAGFTASLTLAGGFLVHLAAGFIATVLLCGLAKLAVAALVDGERLQSTVRRLERQLQRVVIGTAGLIAVFFAVRFFPFAELIFVVVSTCLSFAVAYLVALCFTLGELLSVEGKALADCLTLSLLETEISQLLTLAQELASGRGATSNPKGQTGGLTAVLVLALLLLPGRSNAEEPHSLHLWVDASGSLVAEEWSRLREELANPLQLVEAADFERLTLTPFATERDALMGAPHRWIVPQKPAKSCEAAATVFRATQVAREAECAAGKEQAHAAWQRATGEALADFRRTLIAIDVTKQRRQTCLFPVLTRTAGSPAGTSHLIITDGAHSACGDPPSEPVLITGCAVLVLMPDIGGPGMAGRMDDRRAVLRDLYPGLVVLESWRLESIDRLVAEFERCFRGEPYE